MQKLEFDKAPAFRSSMPLSEHEFQATEIAHELFDKNSLLDLIPPRELVDYLIFY
jgi:hypothetical protein